MELLTYDQIQKKYKMSYKAIQARFARKDVKPVKKERIMDDYGKLYSRALFDSQKVHEVLTANNYFHHSTKKQMDLYKVSIFDFDSAHFIVKKCALSKADAKAVRKDYMSKGFVSRITPQVKRG